MEKLCVCTMWASVLKCDDEIDDDDVYMAPKPTPIPFS